MGEDVPTFVQHYCGEELLPRVVRHAVLLEHVKEMQRSYTKRLEEWAHQLREFDIEWAATHVSMQPSMEFLEEQPERPQVIEVGHMKDLYARTYDLYLEGHFRSLMHRQAVQQKVVFKGCKRVVHLSRSGMMGRQEAPRHDSDGLVR